MTAFIIVAVIFVLLVLYHFFVNKSPVIDEIVYFYHEYYGIFNISQFSYDHYLSYAKRWGAWEQNLTHAKRGLLFDVLISKCSSNKVKLLVLKENDGRAAVAVIDPEDFNGIEDFIVRHY